MKTSLHRFIKIKTGVCAGSVWTWGEEEGAHMSTSHHTKLRFYWLESLLIHEHVPGNRCYKVVHILPRTCQARKVRHNV